MGEGRDATDLGGPVVNTNLYRIILGILGGGLGVTLGTWSVRAVAARLYGWPAEAASTLLERGEQAIVVIVAFVVPFSAMVLVTALVLAIPLAIRKNWGLREWMGFGLSLGDRSRVDRKSR